MTKGTRTSRWTSRERQIFRPPKHFDKFLKGEEAPCDDDECAQVNGVDSGMDRVSLAACAAADEEQEALGPLFTPSLDAIHHRRQRRRRSSRCSMQQQRDMYD